MENQHRKITGYRDLSQAEIDLMNLVKEHGNSIGDVCAAVEALPEADKRAASIAKTHLQTGLMWLTRAIARPQSF